MIDEDSGDEDYNFPPPDITKPSRTSLAEQTRRSRTPGVHSAVEDPEAASAPTTNGLTAPITSDPASAGGALRRYPDGSVATPKILPKRNKGSKVNRSYPT